MQAILLFLLLLGVSPEPRSAQAPVSEEVVATIDGQPIRLGEILPGQDAVDRALFLETGQGLQADRDPELLASIRLRLMKEGLAFQFRERLRNAALTRFGVRAEESEIAAKKQEIFRRIDLQRYEKENLDRSDRLIQALVSIQEGVPEREAFERFGLDNESSFESFQLQVLEYGSPEKIQALRKMQEDFRLNGVANSPAWNLTAAAEVLSEKLNSKIEEELAKTDEEVGRRLTDLKAEGGDAALKLLRERDPVFLEQKRREWWRRQVAQADVEIFRDDLKDALQSLRAWYQAQ